MAKNTPSCDGLMLTDVLWRVIVPRNLVPQLAVLARGCRVAAGVRRIQTPHTPVIAVYADPLEVRR